jgi:hypothetical protein
LAGGERVDKLGLGVFGSFVGIIGAISGFLWVWALYDLLNLGDYFMVQVVTFFIPEPPHLPPVERSPLVIFYPFYQLYLGLNRIIIIGGIHYFLIAAAIVLVGIGLYGFYKLEPLRILRVALILGLFSALIISLVMFSSLTGLKGFAVNIGLLMIYFAQIGAPFSTNIGLLMAQPTVFSSIILLATLILFAFSLRSAEWVTYNPDKARSTSTALILGGLLFLTGIISPVLYIIPYLVLSAAFSLLAHLFRMTQIYG